MESIATHLCTGDFLRFQNPKFLKMKTLKYIFSLTALVLGAQWLTGCSGYLIATTPPPPVMEIVVVAPSPRHVWVPGYYTYRSGTYIQVQGSYQIPPRGRTSYSQGQWQNTPKGYKRGRGHWN
jgi:hypothetical protein